LLGSGDQADQVAVLVQGLELDGWSAAAGSMESLIVVPVHPSATIPGTLGSAEDGDDGGGWVCQVSVDRLFRGERGALCASDYAWVGAFSFRDKDFGDLGGDGCQYRDLTRP
jgi:hypothetical protein